MLVSVWLYFLPSLLDLLFPVWGFHDFENSGIAAGPYNSDVSYVELVSSLTVVVFVNFFWVYATLPQNMRQNDGAGPGEFIYYISIIGLIYLKLIRPCFGSLNRVENDDAEPLYNSKLNSEFRTSSNNNIPTASDDSSFKSLRRWLWRIFGSDYTVGVLIFSLSSTAGLFISIIMAFDNSTDPQYMYGVICSLVFTLGTYALLYASHPLRMAAYDGAGSRDLYFALRKLCGAPSVPADADEALLQ